MSKVLLVILFAIGFVALFVLALSLTLIMKGHNIESEIGDNPNMQKRGIKCVIQEDRELHATDGKSGCGEQSVCVDKNCADCQK